MKLSWRVVRFVRRHPYWTGIIGSLLLAPLILWPGQIIQWADLHEGLAAWVQAVGVIGAIAIPLMIAARAKTAEHREADNTKISNAATLAFKVLEVVNSLPAWLLLRENDRLPSDDIRPQQVRILAEVLDEVDIVSIPDFTITTTMADLRARMATLAEMMKQEMEVVELDYIANVQHPQAATLNADKFRAIASDAKDDCESIAQLVQEWFLRGGRWTPDEE